MILFGHTVRTLCPNKEQNGHHMEHGTDTQRISTPFGRGSTATDVLRGVDLTGRRYIVTGGGSGLGAASVQALAAAGASVTIATRDPSTVDEHVLGTGVEVRELDLADLDSVRHFVRGWSTPVDGLIANAGVMALPDRREAPSGWELQLATNYLGHFALTVGLQEHLGAAGSARVVVVSSGAQRLAPVDFDDPQFLARPYDPWVAYAQSKTAGVLLAVGLARRWASLGIAANAVAPGWIRTRLQRHVDPDALRAMGVYEEDGQLHTPDWFKTPAEGATDQVMLLASPRTAGITGRYFEDGQEAPVVDGGPGDQPGVASWSVDPAAADALWDLGSAALATPRT
jgi:NAD(P)-dependent dehydrogenase (short-subunit alcohol dehydrogenase family)